MPIKSRLTTKGFAEYLEKLAQAGKDIDGIADEALAAGGQVLVAGMLRRVPRLTGNLADHIVATDPVRDGNFHYIDVGLVGADKDTARYGNVQEFGSANDPAQPYVRPTLDNDMRKARDAMKTVFEEKGAM